MKCNPIHSKSLYSNLSPELKLLLACLSHGNGRMGPSSYRKGLSDIDWQSFLALSERHCVGPLIFKAIQNGTLPSCPKEVLKALAVGYKTNVFMSMNFSDALSRLAKRFRTACLPMISLKGPALAQALFDDTSLRVSSDLDILIPPDDLNAVEALLMDMGYQGIGKNRALTRRQKQLLQVVHHHRNFYHPETRLNLEVHWRLNRLNTDFLPQQHFNGLWQRADQTHVNGVPVFILGPIDNFLYLCLHGAFHQWSRLSWLCDIDRMLSSKSGFSIENMMLQSRNHKIEDIIGQTLILLDLLLGTRYCIKLPHWFDPGRALKLAAMALPFMENPETAKEATVFSGHMYRIVFYTFMLLKTNAIKIQYLKGLLMPTDLEIQTLPIPDFLFPLYFLLHPVCTAYRSVSKAAGFVDPFGSSSEI